LRDPVAHWHLDEAAVARVAEIAELDAHFLCLRSTGTSRAPSSSMRTMPIWPRRGLSRFVIGRAV
jgi:hypothetical protein